MTHSGGKEHAVGDKGQRWEVSFFNPDTNARQVYGWTDDHAQALVMSDCVEKHPSWQFGWVTDRHALVEEPKTCLTDGSPITPDHHELKENGQQQGYVVLCPEERAKGFVRPVRQAYKHLGCGMITTMGLALAETYARNPKFYGGTFCATCREHFPVGADGEFVWAGTDEKVGT